MKRRKRNTDDSNFKPLFLIWLFIFIFLGIGFSGHTSTLTVDAMATIQKHIYDYVYITHTEVSDYSGGVSNNFSFLDHEIRADISLPSCNNYVTYRASIVNGTPYKAYITQAGLVNAFNGNGAATTSFSVEFLDPMGNPIVLNDTYIPRYSSVPVDVKIKNNCTGPDTSGVVTVNYEYSLYKYFDLTINSVSPNDGEITLTTTEGNFTGVGSVTHRVMEGETATYNVKKKYYYDANGSYTMMADDHIENVSLIPDPHRDLTINTNVPSSTIVVSQNNQIVCSGSGSLVCSVVSGQNVTFTVDEPEYYYSESGGVYSGYSETFSMPATETTKSVTLTERPWITGRTINTNRGTAATKTDTNWHAGYYLIEAWGGKGGLGDDNDTVEGKSGYAYGIVYISYNTTVFCTAGGNGDRSTGLAAGGANGGGTGGESGSSGVSGHRGAGGGYSAFAVGATAINQANIDNGYVKIIAAAGGGSSARGYTLSTQAGGNGGDGATMNSSTTSISIGTVFSGGNGGTPAGTESYGGGGSTTGGKSGGYSSTAGSLLQGGNADTRGGGGGAGYYGGGGGSVNGRILNNGPGGGGGGSSLIATGVSYSGLPTSVTSKLVGTNPSTTGGAVIITWIGKTM